MVNNNLAPESQPWARVMDALQRSTTERIPRVRENNLMQQQAIAGSLKVLPARIAALQEAYTLLPIPEANTYIQYDTSFPSLVANTWTPAQNFAVNAPPGKSNVEIVVTTTFYLRRNLYVQATKDMFRVTLAGVTYHETPIGFDSTGVCVASTSLAGVGSFDLGVEVLTTNPANIINSGTFPNVVQTFVLSVWS